MKYYLYMFLLLPFCLQGQQGVGKYEIRKTTKKDIIICPHSNQYVPNYSPRKIRAQKNLKSNGATFVPTYVDVPDDFQTAVNFVFETIGQFITSEIPINVTINYDSLENERTLAFAGPGSYVRNFPGASYYETFYPISLAEKLAGKELNSGDDLFITINNTVDWNVLPDNPDIGSKHDLATVLMHEVIHGLGFTGQSSIDAAGELGFLSRLIFARHIENSLGVNLLDSIETGTPEMLSELTSNRIFFNDHESIENARYRLYAPTTYSEGQSIAHLDRANYQGSEDRLMIPFIDRGDVNYNPGISERILHLMGWNITAILHDPKVFSDNESADEDYLVTASVNSDLGFDTTSFVLHYSTDSFGLEDVVVPMDFDAGKDEFSYLLPATGEVLEYQYYFELDEIGGQKRLVPARANDMFFTYNLGEDIIAPVIEGHIALTSIKETDIEFTLKVNDIDDYFTGADTTSLAAVVSLNGVLDTIPFEIIPGEFGDFFEAKFERPEGFDLNDELAYWIILFDKGIRKNQVTLPAEGAFEIAIQEVAAAIVTYVNDFDSPSRDFTGSGFTTSAPNGFDDPAIHTEHPYMNAGDDNTLNFTYELKQLILLEDRNPIIKFDEIVIVEPGEANTSCRGNTCPLEFWDYVVVEGKKVGGTEWEAFHDAYDARDNQVFLNAYNNEQNGSKGLFRPKTIDLLENGKFKAGDQVFVRFRLFSDPFAVGWGWAVDNLEIQPVGTSTLDEQYIETFDLYPNPISKDQILTLNIQLKEKFNGELSLVNTVGQHLINTKITSQNNIKAQWNLSALTSGIYYAQLKNKDGVSVRKIVID